jgi:2-methylcitrate dehydratase PrpD
VGLAASSALRAALLARAGVDGAEEAFEQGGYFRAYSGGETDRFPQSQLAFGRPFALDKPGFEQKRYPCCYMVHKMIEGALALRRASGITLDDVARARVLMPSGGTKPLIHPFPQSGLNGKFSGPYAVAASLADGKIDIASFTDEAVGRPAAPARLRDVEVVEETNEVPPGTDLGRMPVTVTLTLRDGRELRHTVIASPGSPEDPMTPAQLRAKWVDCVGHGRPGVNAEVSGSWFDRGMELGREDRVGDWLRAVLSRDVPA